MITTKVFKVKSDVKTRCHCGHEIAVDNEYFIIRTTVPKWVSLCVNCVHLIAQPVEVSMKELKGMWAWEEPKLETDFVLRVKKDKIKAARAVKKAKTEEALKLLEKGACWV